MSARLGGSARRCAWLSGALAAALVHAAAGGAGAAMLFVGNHSFEDPVLAGGQISSTVPEWTRSGTPLAGGVVNDTNTFWNGTGGNAMPAPATGANAVYVIAMRDLDPEVRLSQTLSSTVQAGNIYTLTVAVGAHQSSSYTLSYDVRLLMDGASVGTKQFAAPALGAFADQTVTYTALSEDAGKSITIELAVPAPSATPQYFAGFDNVRLEAVVPEPATVGGLGVVALLAMRRRRA